MALSKLSGSRILAGGGLVPVVKKFGINTVPDGTEQNTNIVLPAKCAVLDVWLDIRAAEVTGTIKTIDIGTDGAASNDPNGFATALDVSATGILLPSAAVTVATESYFSATTRGALLSVTFAAGADVATDVGTNYEIPDLTSGGDTVTFTAGDVDWVEFRGDIYVVMADLS
jgi:hypothetical protein